MLPLSSSSSSNTNNGTTTNNSPQHRRKPQVVTNNGQQHHHRNHHHNNNGNGASTNGGGGGGGGGQIYHLMNGGTPSKYHKINNRSNGRSLSSCTFRILLTKLALPSIFCFAMLLFLFGHQHIRSFESIVNYDIMDVTKSSFTGGILGGPSSETISSKSSYSISSSGTRNMKSGSISATATTTANAKIQVPELPILTFLPPNHDELIGNDDPRISVESYFTTTAESLIKKTNNTHSNAKSDNNNKDLIIDILSVASKTRSHYYKTQRETWASHNSIRYFIVVTEDDDPEPTCYKDIEWKQVENVSRWCKTNWSDMTKRHKGGFGATWVQQRFSHFYAGIPWLKSKPNPMAWLCAQKRFPTGLAKTLLEIYHKYSNQGVKLPDYLLVVDDDTYYDIDIFQNEMLNILKNTPSDPYVATGCRITNGKDRDKGIVFSYGGFGLVFSKGSIERLLRPIHCNKWQIKPQYQKQPTLVPLSSSSIKIWEKKGEETKVDIDTATDTAVTSSNSSNNNNNYDIEWEDEACFTVLNNHLINEYPLFTNGMSTIELMYEVTKSQPFLTDIATNWTTGYCFHGHWVLSYFNQHYRISMPHTLDKKGNRIPVSPHTAYGILETLQYSEINSFNGKQSTTGLCKNGREKELPFCPPQSLVCHYQTPDMMKLIHSNNYTLYDNYVQQELRTRQRLDGIQQHQGSSNNDGNNENGSSGTAAGRSDISLSQRPIKTLPAQTSTSSFASGSSALPPPTNVTIDVISITTKSHSKHSKAQRRTWASHVAVRNFFVVNEDDDIGLDSGSYNQCVNNLSMTDVSNILKYCNTIWGDMGLGSTWLMKRYSHSFTNSMPYTFGQNGQQQLYDFNDEIGPSSWLCSQKRTPMTLIKVLLQHYTPPKTKIPDEEEDVTSSATSQISLPDYLFVVDDGTYYDIDKLLAKQQQKQGDDYLEEDNQGGGLLPIDSITPYAGTGCKVINGKDETRGISFNHGGYGLIYSLGSLKRLLQPIHCRNGFTGAGAKASYGAAESSSVSEWNDVICGVIRDGTIKETHFFRDGMNVLELIQSYITRSLPYTEYTHWDHFSKIGFGAGQLIENQNSLGGVGYCMQSSWLMSYIIQHYRIGGIPSDKTLATSYGILESIEESELRVDSKHISSATIPKSTTGLCHNNGISNDSVGGGCSKESIGCFGQTPKSMSLLYNSKMGIDDGGLYFESDSEEEELDADSNISDKASSTAVAASSGNSIDDGGLVHVLKTRFMQFQPNLLSLGQARLDLFKTFCLPTIVNQSVGLDKFIWIIRTDPDLVDEILSKLVEMIEPYPSFILIKSNNNTEGLRELKVEDPDFIQSVVVGDIELLKQYVKQSQRNYVIESRLDADDGLHSNMLELIQYKAKQYQVENRLSALMGGTSSGKKDQNIESWRLYCVETAVEWHTGWLFHSDEAKRPPDHGLLVISRDALCITPGLSFVLPPTPQSLKRPPSVGHHMLAKRYPECSSSTKHKCLEWWSQLEYPQAIRARTPTSAGMGGFHKQYKDDRNSDRLWKLLDSKFHITQDMTTKTKNMFHQQLADIAKDNIKGQCTEDHSCTDFAKRALDKLAWRAEQQQLKKDVEKKAS